MFVRSILTTFALLYAGLAFGAASFPTLTPQPKLEKGAGAELAATIQAGPNRLYFRELGAGRPVILLHGLGGDTTRWDQSMVPLAAAGYRAIALDMLGFGLSEKPSGPYRVARLAQSLSAFLDALDLKDVVVVGNSLGGWTAAELALADPSRIAGLALVDAGYGYAAGTNPATLSSRALPASREDLGHLLQLVFADHARFASPDAVERAWVAAQAATNRHVIESLIASINRGEDVLDGRLGALRVPTLVLSGRDDLLTPLALSERMAAEIPGARLVAIDRCGHLPQVECPEPFNTALIAFLREVDLKGPSR